MFKNISSIHIYIYIYIYLIIYLFVLFTYTSGLSALRPCLNIKYSKMTSQRAPEERPPKTADPRAPRSSPKTAQECPRAAKMHPRVGKYTHGEKVEPRKLKCLFCLFDQSFVLRSFASRHVQTSNKSQNSKTSDATRKSRFFYDHQTVRTLPQPPPQEPPPQRPLPPQSLRGPGVKCFF